MSTLKVNTLEEATAGGATFFTAKAWVNFNGTGTVAINADGNVSSITDNATGNYTINFSSSLTDGNYAWAFGCRRPDNLTNTALVNQGLSDTKSSSAMNFETRQGSWPLTDFVEVNITVTR